MFTVKHKWFILVDNSSTCYVPLLTGEVDSAMECGVLCSSTPDCSSFHYFLSDRRCVLGEPSTGCATTAPSSGEPGELFVAVPNA